MYNLNYAPTILGVQSRREIKSGGTRTKKVEYHCIRGCLQLKVGLLNELKKVTRVIYSGVPLKLSANNSVGCCLKHCTTASCTLLFDMNVWPMRVLFNNPER
jgi:hypothetical protein